MLQKILKWYCKKFGHKWVVTLNTNYRTVRVCERCGKIEKMIKG